MKKTKRKKPAAPPAWTPFYPAVPSEMSESVRMALGVGGTIWKNSRYQVVRRGIPADMKGEDWPDMIWLSIRNLENTADHDWRDLQRIKTELVGAENEAGELFPAESRLVDGANQFHLWVLADPAIRFPFGFAGGRMVVDGSKVLGNVKQRPFEER